MIVEVSSTIARPIEEVFAYAANPRNWPHYSSWMMAVTLNTEGPLRPGTTFEVIGRFLGRQFKNTCEVVAFEPNQQLIIRTTEADVPYQFHYVYEPVEGGTKCTVRASTDATDFFRLATPLFAKVARRQLGSDAANLKWLLEQSMVISAPATLNEEALAFSHASQGWHVIVTITRIMHRPVEEVCAFVAEVGNWPRYAGNLRRAVARILRRQRVSDGPALKALIEHDPMPGAAGDNARLIGMLKEQQQRLNSLIATVPGIVWEAWSEPDEHAQRIDFVSDYVEQMLGYTIDEWLSTPDFWLSIVHPEDQERARQEVSATFASGEEGSMQFRWLTKEGRAIWVESCVTPMLDETGAPVGMRGVTLDITERKRAEPGDYPYL